MTSSSKYKAGLKRLLDRLEVTDDSVVLVHESEMISKLVSRLYLSTLQEVVDEGTISILGDCRLNTGSSSQEKFSTQERLVLSSGPMLQLMTLQDDCFYVSHPSLMLASVGKYARYLARHREIDFPYGKDSVFDDFYGMNTIVLFIGNKHELVEIKYAYSKRDDALIRKDISYLGSQLVNYLDIEVEIEKISEKIFSSDLLLSEDLGDHVLYGINFKTLIGLIESVI